MHATLLRALAAASLVASLAGCVASPPIVIDGDPGEWPAGAEALIDREHIYLRFAPASRVTLQGGQRCTRILLDLDADDATGLALAGVGAELEIQISPLAEDSGGPLSRGVRVLAHASEARPRTLSHADVGLTFAPTYASNQYEARISLDRLRAVLAGVPEPRDEAARSFLARVLQTDASGAVLWESDPIEARALSTRAQAATGVLPSRPSPPAIRVVSHNVLRTSPERETDRFARLYRAIDPDVVLVQEWDGYTASQLAAWFRVQVPIEGEWRAVAHESERAGVAVVSRYPIIEAIDRPVHAPGGDWPVRFVGAILDTPGAPTLVGSIHLKCCGYAGSDEDVRREHEARAINAAVRAALDTHAVERCVLAGDLNLVGSRPPLDLLRAGLDADGSDLEAADARVLGDDALLSTWTFARAEFSPGRLDWLVFSDSTLSLSSASVLDTGELSDADLRRMSLERDDSRASDHLAVIVDLAPILE